MTDLNKTEALLDILMHSGQEFVSGEEISRQLSISRTAVWKQINKLREAGYEFEAIPHKGYRMVSRPERLHAPTIRNAIEEGRMGSQVYVLDRTLSTQEEAKQLAEEGAQEGTLVITEEQSGGRGRMGRKWFSPYGKGVWMSLVLRPGLPLHLTPQLTLVTGVAVCRAIRQLTGLQAGIKWPNDIFIEGRKVCGILLESAAEDGLARYCIAGIGISANLAKEDYPEELKTIATSLAIELGSEVNRTALIAEVMKEFEVLYALYLKEGLQPIAVLWEQLSIHMNQPIQVRGAQGIVTGKAVGLEASGALLVEVAGGQVVPIFSGDVEGLQ